MVIRWLASGRNKIAQINKSNQVKLNFFFLNVDQDKNGQPASPYPGSARSPCPLLKTIRVGALMMMLARSSTVAPLRCEQLPTAAPPGAAIFRPGLMVHRLQWRTPAARVMAVKFLELLLLSSSGPATVKISPPVGFHQPPQVGGRWGASQEPGVTIMGNTDPHITSNAAEPGAYDDAGTALYRGQAGTGSAGVGGDCWARLDG